MKTKINKIGIALIGNPKHLFFMLALLLIGMSGSIPALANHPDEKGAPAASFLDGNIIYVDSSAALSGDGFSWEQAVKTLQEALDIAAASPDTKQIWVKKGTYYPTATSGGATDRFKTFAIDFNVRIYGGFHGGETSLNERDWVVYKTILSGELGNKEDSTDNAYHVIKLAFPTNASIGVDGFTITSGNANGSGGNDNGGGIVISGTHGTASINNCIITDNAASGDGGGAYVVSGSHTIFNCTFDGNFSQGNGAGIRITSGLGAPILSRCLFRNNLASLNGAAIYSSSNAPQIVNCVFFQNRAFGKGGAIGLVTTNAILTNNTFAANNAVSGGSVYAATNSNLTITNCVSWGNLPDALDFTNDGSGTMTFSHTLGQIVYPGIGNISTDPKYVDKLSGNLHLLSISPAIDAGTPTNAPLDDYDGLGRPIGAEYDMGAFEYLAQAPVAHCKDIVISIGANGTLVLTANDIDDGSYDPDGAILARNLSETNFNCSQTGIYLISMVVKDNDGLDDECFSKVNVIDGLPPVLICPASITVSSSANTCSKVLNPGVPTASDNCSPIVVKTNSFNGGSIANGAYPVGVTTVVWTGTDGSGTNAGGTCSMTITVEDNHNPSATCPVDLTKPAGNINVPIPTNMSDNCGIDHFEGRAFVNNKWKSWVSSLVRPKPLNGIYAAGSYPMQYRILDVNGNKKTCSFTLTVVNNLIGNNVDPSLPIGVTDETAISDNTDALNLQCYPNPFGADLSIRFSLSEDADVALTLVDLTGRQVKELFREKKEAGDYNFLLNGNDLGAGIYFVRLQANDHTQLTKVVLIK